MGNGKWEIGNGETLAGINKGLSGDLIVNLDAMTVSCLAYESCPWLSRVEPDRRECALSHDCAVALVQTSWHQAEANKEQNQKQNKTQRTVGRERREVGR